MRQLNNKHFDTIEGASARQGEVVSSASSPLVSQQKDENKMLTKNDIGKATIWYAGKQMVLSAIEDINKMSHDYTGPNDCYTYGNGFAYYWILKPVKENERITFHSQSRGKSLIYVNGCFVGDFSKPRDWYEDDKVDLESLKSLIASAPEMLDMLKRVADGKESIPRKEVRELITKAQGGK